MENELINILYIDDEKAALFNFKQLFQDDFEVYTAFSAAKAMEILEATDIQIIISDQRMPDKTGIEFFAEVAQLYPNTLRILLTAYSEAADIIDAINRGQVYQYITKPFETLNVKNILDKAAQNWRLKKENELLIAQLQNKNEEYEVINEELKQTNEELIASNKNTEESKNQTKEILQTAMDGFWIVDLKGKFIEVNEVACKMLGYSRTEMLKFSISDLEIVETAEQTQKHIQKIFEIGEDRFETKHRHKNGEIIGVELSVKFQRDQNLIVAFVRDITERKQAETKIIETQMLLQACIESPKDMIILEIDKNYQYLNFNSVHKNVMAVAYGIDVEIGMNLLNSITNEEDRKKAKINYDRALNGESHLTIEEFGDIERYYYETSYNPILNEKNEIIGTTAFSTNITDRKQAEEALKLSEQRYRFSLESTGQIGWSTPPDGVVEDMPMWREYSGQSLDEVVGWKWLDAVHPDDRESAYLAWSTAAAQKINYFTEYRIRRADGVYRNFMVRGIPLLNTDGSCKEWVGTCIDITERKQSEETLVKSRISLQEALEDSNRGRQTLLSVLEDQRLADREIQKLNAELEQRVKTRTALLEAANKELETFTYSVSHDLKAPLRGIDGYSKLLLDIYSKDLNEEAKAFISTIRSSTMQMNQLIEDLLEYSRLERSNLSNEKVKLIALVDSITTLYKNDLTNANFVLKLDIPDVELITDEKGLTIVLRNILENAIKFTKEKSNPTIEIGYTDQPTSWIIRVKDNGIGFDMKYHQRIFEIFQRLHRAEDYAGTGIGLAMVSKGIQRLNGKVWAESIPGEGSTFYLEIPKL